jgi:beta-phosphoglucomutase-like phosphatase (HAD superfamily)/dTDP-glucose pyrophosphorylase
MENRLVIFDLDGVLVESKDLHFDALNVALSKVQPGLTITKRDHHAKFDGLDTKTKLSMLVKSGHLRAENVEHVWELKQQVTANLMSAIPKNLEVPKVFKLLKSKGFTTAVASNSIRATLDSEIRRLGISQFVDFSLSNEDVTMVKPHPEIYWKAMIIAKKYPRDTLILEDSSIGRRAAMLSGAKLIPIDSPKDINLAMVKELILKDSKKASPMTSWKSASLNVVIPMAGAGSRFAQAGYAFPKPLIEIMGKSMIEVVLKNLQIEANFIFLVQKEHDERFNLRRYLGLLAPNSQVVIVDSLTDGAARTVLFAEELIDNPNPLLIANSDQFVDWDSSEILYQFEAASVDGGLVTFKSTHPKWSFARVDEDGWVSEVAEKQPISDIATTGIYYWAKGSDFVRFAKQMIDKDIRTNGEFYICPVYNEAIGAGLKIRARSVDRMWGLGTPEDLTAFLADNEAMELLASLG